jgi:hypothetical protein
VSELQDEQARPEWQCGVQTARMKGPCVLWKEHIASGWPGAQNHESARVINEDTPRLRQFAGIVNRALDEGVHLSYVEIGEIMGHPNPRSVAQYGLGSRYTKLRQKIYRERGIAREEWRGRTPEQLVLRELKLKGMF